MSTGQAKEPQIMTVNFPLYTAEQLKTWSNEELTAALVWAYNQDDKTEYDLMNAEIASRVQPLREELGLDVPAAHQFLEQVRAYAMARKGWEVVADWSDRFLLELFGTSDTVMGAKRGVSRFLKSRDAVVEA